MARHLGLANVGDPEIFTALAEASPGLATKVGWPEAGRRHAFLPTAVPGRVFEAFQEAFTGGDDSEADLREPFAAGRMYRLRARVRAGTTAEEFGEEAEALVRGIANEGKAFVALVRHGAQQAMADQAWRRLSPEAMVIFLWAWAGEVASELTRVGADPDGFGRWLTGAQSRDLRAWDAQVHLPNWARRLAVSLSLDDLMATTVGAVILDVGVDRLGEAAVQVLREACGRDGDEGYVPLPAILPPPPLGPAPMWAGADPILAFVEAGWIEREHPFANRDPSTMVEALLAGGPDWWRQPAFLMLLVAFDLSRVEARLLPGLRVALEDLIENLPFEPEQVGAYRLALALGIVLGRQSGRKVEPAPDGAALTGPEKEELLRLRHENKQLRLERDILSRATA